MRAALPYEIQPHGLSLAYCPSGFLKARVRMDEGKVLELLDGWGAERRSNCGRRAAAWADILLTLDDGDFGGFMDKPFYDLSVLRPGVFLERERAAGRLR